MRITVDGSREMGLVAIVHATGFRECHAGRFYIRVIYRFHFSYGAYVGPSVTVCAFVYLVAGGMAIVRVAGFIRAIVLGSRVACRRI